MNAKRSGIIELQPYITHKKLRSQRPCRVRAQISPILKNRGSEVFTTHSVDSSSGTQFNLEEASCDSSVVSVGSNLKKNSNKRQFDELENAPFRRITRSIQKQIENQRKENREVEVTDSSCVESNSSALFGKRSSKLKKNENANEIEEVANEVSEISCKIALTENAEDDGVSFTSAVVDSCSVAKLESSFTESVNKESCMKYENDSLTDLACSEQLSTHCDDVSVYSSSHETVFSDLQYSDVDFSDYSQSSFFHSSGSEFSEKSFDDPPSHTYALLLEFRQQFTRSTSSQKVMRNASNVEDEEEYHNLSQMRFENDEDEECYKMLRSRERRQVFVHDYGEEYLSTTEYGNLIIEQRSQMVHWIVEQCRAKEYQEETLFLAVGVIDRFLTKGYFKNRRSLHIVGVACLTLAIRIEENQPYNSVRQRNFYVGSNVYPRCEVVAMEWLVQEVLDFHCTFATIYNFLWFYLKAARADEEMTKRVKYFAVLLLSDHEHLCHWPSTVAASLVILASSEENQERIIKIHTRTKDNDLPDSIKTDIRILGQVNDYLS